MDLDNAGNEAFNLPYTSTSHISQLRPETLRFWKASQILWFSYSNPFSLTAFQKYDLETFSVGEVEDEW